MEVEIEGKKGELEWRLHQLCRDLLSNRGIKDYELLNREPPQEKQTKTKTASKKRDESAAIFFLRGFSATGSADDRSHREFLSKPHFDVTRLDSGGHSRVSRRERLSRRTTRSRRRALKSP